MGVGLYLIGSFAGEQAGLLEQIEAFFRRRYRKDLVGAWLSRDGARLSLLTHPAASCVEISQKPGQGGVQIVASATTSSVGPGYHADLCEALREAGEALSISWAPSDEDEGTGDETGYFETGDRAALEREMLHWLSTVARVVSENHAGQQVMISMPTEPRYRGPEGAAVLTQLGPRDRAWLDAVLADASAGKDIFAWWEPGRGAAYELGRSLVHLWLDVRFHPAATEEEEELGRELLQRLGRAYRLDPSLDYPWAAWESLHDDVVDADDDDLSQVIRKKARQQGRNEVGYRLRDVDVTFGRWVVTIPGSFSGEQDERGTWTFWEDDLCVQVTTLSFSDGDAPLPAAKILESKALEGDLGAVEGLALPHRANESSYRRDGQRFFSLTAAVAVDGELLLLTASFSGREQIAWARGLIASARSTGQAAAR